jgi:hypothetical protein
MLEKTLEFRRLLSACATGETANTAPAAMMAMGSTAVSLRRLLIPVIACLSVSLLSSGS